MPNFDFINSVGFADKILIDATPRNAAVCRAFVHGDHFQSGTQWLGPPPPPAEYDAAIQSLQKVFVPIPLVEEMVDGHVTGAVGHEPSFENAFRSELGDGQERTPEEQNAKSIADSEFGDWFDRRGALTIFQDWLSKQKSGGENEGRATLRLMVPPGLLSDDGERVTVDVADVTSAMELIYLESPDPETATVYTDPETKRDCGLFRYESKTKSELSNRTLSKQRVELVFVADEDDAGIAKGQTVIRVMEGKTIVSQTAIDMGGFSLMHEGRLPSLLSAPVLANQRAADTISTMLHLNAAYAGFRKTDMFNVTDKPDDENGKPTEVKTGPTQIGFWYSQPYKEKDGGEIKYFPPQLIVTEPVDSESLRLDIRHHEHVVRRACKQFHAVLSGDAAASAVSRIQARAVFSQDLLRSTPVVEDALRWLQMAVRCFALWLCNKENEIPAFLEQFTPYAQCKPSTGPLTPEEVRVLIEMYKAGLVSRQDAALIYGVEDIDLHLQHIETEESGNLEHQIKQAEIFTVWAQTFDALDAAKLAGIEDERIRSIIEGAGNAQSTAGGGDEK